jgi:hypothetical protein
VVFLNNTVDLEQFVPRAGSLSSLSFNGGSPVMFDNGNVQRDKLHDELATLREEAIARLERRGYEVRGKTPAQIRSALKRRPKKRKSAEASE